MVKPSQETESVLDQVRALKEKYEKELGSLAPKIKLGITMALTSALDGLNSLSEQDRNEVLNSDGYIVLVKSLGANIITATTRKGAGRGKAAAVSDDKILEVLSKDKGTNTRTVAKEIGLSEVTTANRLRKLRDKKQVTMEQDGVSNLWKKV